MNNNQKGFSSILLLLIVLVIVGIGAYLYTMKGGTDYSALNVINQVKEVVKSDDFKELNEPLGTPEAINNKALDELDALMNDIESVSEGEDFSDLNL